MLSERRRPLRRVTLFGVPISYAVLGLLHPMTNPRVGEPTDLWIRLHCVQLLLIVGLGVLLQTLLHGVEGRAATVGRALILPFVVVYTTLDSILGLAWGIVASRATELRPADHAATQRLLDRLLEPTTAGHLLYFGAGALWLSATLAVVAAHSGRAPAPALGLITAGGVAFALGHARPTGPVGMLLFVLGVAWLELRAARDARLGSKHPDAAPLNG